MLTLDADSERLRRLHVALSGNLEACSTFEQFFHRLRTQTHGEYAEPEIDFESVESELKSIELELEGDSPEGLHRRLETVEEDLERKAAILREQDSRVAGSELRRFVSRSSNLDEDLLFEIVRFHLFANRGRKWDAALVDKIDFLLSRLAEQVAGATLQRDAERLDEMLAVLWETAAVEAASPPVARALREQVLSVWDQLAELESLEELDEASTISGYRRLKHGLGSYLVEPSVANAVVATNAALGRKVRRLFENEEWQIASDFTRLAHIEWAGGLSEALCLEVESLRAEMDRFEHARLEDDVRVASVRWMSRQVRELRPHLAELDTDESAEPAEEAAEVSVETGAEQFTEELGSSATADLSWHLLDKLFHQLETLLAADGSVEEAEHALQDPGLPFELERREIEAFLWMRDHAAENRELDRLVLTAAALRLHLKVLREGMEAIGDETLVDASTVALELAEELQTRFDIEIADARRREEEEWASEARTLKVLLMRDYTILYLQMHGAN